MTETNWQTTLIADGATIDESTNQRVVTGFGNPTAELMATVQSDNVLCDLSHLALLEVSGADAIGFLQGQVTNDVKLLNGNNAHYSGYCNPKGRLLALFLAFAHQDLIHLQLDGSIAESIIKRLKMYVMRAKVDIQDKSDTIIKFGISGRDAPQILAKLFEVIPQQDYTLTTLENATLLKLPSTDNQHRFEVFTNKSYASQLWQQLKTECRPVGKACWDWLEIQAGIPEITLATQEAFVPQMVNLDILNGINFKKGCYTGQEIVARTHYLGSVKRRTYLASIKSSTMPAAGDKVTDETGSEVGLVVRAAPNLDAGLDVLIELRIEAKQSGQIFWNQNPIDFKSMPYPV